MEASFIKCAFKKSHYPPPDRPEIAFAGKSNVGKSSLINALVNRKNLARTGATPGRTQSINFFNAGKSLYLVDLPGYGFAKVPVRVKISWRDMVENYLSSRSNLKAVVVIMDIRREPNQGDKDLLGWLNHYGIPDIIVITKADKLSRGKAHARLDIFLNDLQGITKSAPILFSSKTSQGKDELWDRIMLAAKN